MSDTVSSDSVSSSKKRSSLVESPIKNNISVTSYEKKTAGDDQTKEWEFISELPKHLDDISNASYVNLSGLHFNISLIPKNVTHLNLDNSKLGGEILPELLNLRSLSINYCGLSDFSLIKNIVSLISLSATGNSFSSLKDMPILPNLCILDLRNNSNELPPVPVLRACSSTNIHHFNGHALNESDIKDAYGKSPIIGMALRCGAAIETDDELTARDFLTRDLTEKFKNTKDSNYVKVDLDKKTASIEVPGAYDIKWYTNFTRDNLYNQWKLINKNEQISNYKVDPNTKKKDVVSNKTGLNTEEEQVNYNKTSQIETNKTKNLYNDNHEQCKIINIDDSMFQHLLKCEFKLYDKEAKKDLTFCVFTDNVIGYEEGSIILPYPITPDISGPFREGSLILTIPMSIKAKIVWFIDDTVLEEDSSSIKLTHEHVKRTIMCILRPYMTYFPSIMFTELKSKSKVITGIDPIVSGIEFPSILVEGTEINFTGQVNSLNNNDLKIRIERSLNFHSDWEHCEQLDPNNLFYKPSKDDINHYLRIVYSFTEYDEKSNFYFYSTSRVIPGKPMFSKPKIIGCPFVNGYLLALAIYSGGNMGHSIYRWYSSDDGSFSDRMLIFEGSPHLRTIDEVHLGRYISCEMIPIRDDDITGEPQEVRFPEPIQKEQETIHTADDLPQEIYTSKPIEVYENANWFITSPSSEDGFVCVGQGKEFIPSEEYIGQFLKVEFNRHNIVLGQIQKQKSHRRISFKLNLTDACVGSKVSIPDSISSSNSEILWMRVKNNKAIVVDVDSRSYEFSNDDLNSCIKAVVILLDENRDQIGVMYSDMTPVIELNAKQLYIRGEFFVGASLTPACSKTIHSVSWYISKDSEFWELVQEQSVDSDKNEIGAHEFKLSDACVGSYIMCEATIDDESHKGGNGYHMVTFKKSFAISDVVVSHSRRSNSGSVSRRSSVMDAYQCRDLVTRLVHIKNREFKVTVNSFETSVKIFISYLDKSRIIRTREITNYQTIKEGRDTAFIFDLEQLNDTLLNDKTFYKTRFACACVFKCDDSREMRVYRSSETITPRLDLNNIVKNRLLNIDFGRKLLTCTACADDYSLDYEFSIIKLKEEDEMKSILMRDRKGIKEYDADSVKYSDKKKLYTFDDKVITHGKFCTKIDEEKRWIYIKNGVPYRYIEGNEVHDVIQARSSRNTCPLPEFKDSICVKCSIWVSEPGFNSDEIVTVNEFEEEVVPPKTYSSTDIYIESNTNLLAKKGSFTFTGNASVGKGEWDITFNKSGVHIKSKNGKDNEFEWKHLHLEEVDGYLKMETGPTSTYLINVSSSVIKKDVDKAKFLIVLASKIQLDNIKKDMEVLINNLNKRTNIVKSLERMSEYSQSISKKIYSMSSDNLLPLFVRAYRAVLSKNIRHIILQKCQQNQKVENYLNTSLHHLSSVIKLVNRHSTTCNTAEAKRIKKLSAMRLLADENLSDYVLLVISGN